MNKLNFAIIGCGRIGQRHAEHIANNGNLVAVCDIVPDAAGRLSEKYGAKSFLSVTEMLQDKSLQIDLVAICSPNGVHASHAIECLRAGFHVLCEKPMALSVHDCGNMIQEAEKANRRLFVIKQNRFNPPVAAVKRLLDEGKLGKVFSVQLSCFWNRNEDYYKNSWKGTKDLDGGTLFTQFSHFIDLLYWMFGDVKRVQSMMGNFNHQGIIEFEDTGVIALEFQHGVLGTINYNVNSYGKNMEGSLTIFGELGTIKIGGQYLNELEYQNIKDYRIENLPTGNTANSYGNYQGSMSNHDKVYENVVDVLTKGGTISTNGFEGLKTVDIIERIYASANAK
jgi:UDP-N-acetyl-2-amino-2-deoxyglucuronate dehydrogenase